MYNAFFHPYAKYPGPLLAKFTNLYSAYHAWIGDIHVDMHKCHEKYGTQISRRGTGIDMADQAKGITFDMPLTGY